jgi:hypothetical protein
MEKTCRTGNKRKRKDPERGKEAGKRGNNIEKLQPYAPKEATGDDG